jgi:single-stranded-DNA-specific exonuclease
MLMDTVRIDPSHVDTDDIAFKLAPRLNAAGRMGHALSSVDLLSANQVDTAAGMVEILEDYNVRRKTLEDKTCMDIQMALRSNPDLLKRKSLVLFHPKWHEGVIGIAASRMARKLCRPVILITAQNGMGKGSARSIDEVDLHDGLSRCQDLLLAFGGHAMAAGLSILPERVPAFTERFEQAVQNMTGAHAFHQQVRIDYDLSFSLITEKLLDELERMQPFGKDNPEPLFLSREIKVVKSYVIGQHHRKMVLKQYGDSSNRVFPAIQFNVESGADEADYFEHLLFRLRYNRLNGKKTIQILVEET